MLLRDGGKYPPWGESPEWDRVLEIKRQMTDCQRYHCLPSQLDGEDYHVLELHRSIEAAERKYHAEDARLKSLRPK